MLLQVIYAISERLPMNDEPEEIEKEINIV
jgi:hypothetical protein